MKRFFIKYYDASGYTLPNTYYGMDEIQTTYQRNSLLASNFYVDSLNIVTTDYLNTPSSVFAVLESDINIVEHGEYYFKVIVGANVRADIFVNGEYVAFSSLNSGVGAITLPIGINTIRVRMVGPTTTATLNTTWMSPSDTAYVDLPIEVLPILSKTMFPFEIFDSVSEVLDHKYVVAGEEFQKQYRISDKNPYKKFSVTLKQDDVYDRLALKSWFSTLKGKYKSFLFPSFIPELSIAEQPIGGENFLVIKNSFAAMALNQVTKILYLPDYNYFGVITSCESKVNETYGTCDVIVLDTPLPDGLSTSSCLNAQFLYFCRLDTDTISFDLDDINKSSVKLNIIELYNDYSLIQL
jgi:hypothetical protein